MQAMKDWHKSHPHLFVKSPRNLPGRDTQATPRPGQTARRQSSPEIKDHQTRGCFVVFVIDCDECFAAHNRKTRLIP